MDITKSSKKVYSTKLINGETINYSFLFLTFGFIFVAFKQLLKLIFNVPAELSMLASFIICSVALFFFEKKFVFNKKTHTKSAHQILMLIFNIVVNFGIYKVLDFLFCDVLSLSVPLCFIITSIVIFIFKYFYDKIVVFESTFKAKNSKNGRLYKNFFNNRFVLFSMLIAIVTFVFFSIVIDIAPIGKNSLLRMDLYHQYGPLFCEFYDRIVNHQSFIYSWTSGGGSSFLGNYFNYLSSPLSFLIFLFNRKEIATGISAIIMLKGVLSAGTFTYFIKKSFNSHSYATSAFGVLYAFSGYYLAYYWNIMWIDGMILLPLIALGIERIINDNKPVLYICSLTLLLFSTYYIGFMVCIFSVIYFLMYFAIHSNESNTLTKIDKKQSIAKRLMSNRFFSRCVTFAISSILCAMLCAVTLIPTFMILKQCSATSDSFPSSASMFFDFMDFISCHFAGLETTIRSSGDDVLPNIYCGILGLMLVPLYVMNKEINIKEKTISIFVLVLMAICINNNYTNFIWQAFHFPNDLPYRFSFVYVFLFLIVAFRALEHIKGVRQQDIVITGMMMLFVVLYFQKNPTNKISDLTIYSSLGFIFAWTLVLMLIRKEIAKKALLGILIVTMVFCELIISEGQNLHYSSSDSEYFDKYDEFTEAIDIVHQNDNGFYRTEISNLRTRNDPCIYRYNGMSVFSSMAYEKYSETQYALGMFGNRINSFTYNPQTPVYNMMFGLKYILRSDTDANLDKTFYTFEGNTKSFNTDIYKNKYYLPVAFVTSSDIEDAVIIEGDPFEAQEEMIDCASGVSNVFVPVKFSKTSATNAMCDDVTGNGTISFTSESVDEGAGTIDFEISPIKDGNIYVYIKSPSIENVNYNWGDNDTINQGIEEPYIIDLGYHKSDEPVTVSLDLSNVEDGSSYFEIYAYSVDKDVLESAYDMLREGSFDITKYNDTTLEGTVVAGYDGDLFTSIPYDDAWDVYIDGEKVDTFSIGESMLATSISEGEHKVKLKYNPKGLKYGFVITLTAWLCIIAYFVIKRIFNRKKEENEIC